MKRSIRIFATKEDLQSIFGFLQEKFQIYYVPTYSDEPYVQIKDITSIPYFGMNIKGRTAGNNQFLAFFKESYCNWRTIKIETENMLRYSTLDDKNVENIYINVGGVHDTSNLFPTEISTLHYDNEVSKQLFNGLKRVISKNTSVTINGYMICKNAYEYRNKYRFCTIDINSPQEYNLVVK